MRNFAFLKGWVVLGALLLAVAPAGATICEVANTPGATLLLPYFEVDLKGNNGITTLFAVNNSNAAAVLVHVVLWSDLAVPVLDFNMYLTGFDEQTVNLRDVLINGMLPQTASAGQDLADTISPKGTFSQDINFASCNGVLPPPALPASLLTHLHNSLTGKPSALLGGLCAGRALGDNIARGYITMDTVNNCTLRFPADAGYFGNGDTGDVTNQNWLFGDYTYQDKAQKSAQTYALVAISASFDDPRVTTPGNYTFYGAFDGFTAIDNRSPLPTTFGARYSVGGATGDTTDFIAWRDPKMPQSAFTCPAAAGVRPVWYPLGQEDIVIFDQQEHPVVPDTSFTSPAATGLTPFGAAAQRTSVGGAQLPVPFTSGWAFLDMNTQVIPAGSAAPPRTAQAWITEVLTSSGIFKSGVDAMHYDSACNPNTIVPNF